MWAAEDDEKDIGCLSDQNEILRNIFCDVVGVEEGRQSDESYIENQRHVDTHFAMFSYKGANIGCLISSSHV